MPADVQLRKIGSAGAGRIPQNEEAAHAGTARHGGFMCQLNRQML